MKTAYQPRYVAYAKANGKTPDAMLDHDCNEYPGGRMAGFICWVSVNLRAFRKANPRAFLGDSLHDQDAFTAYLQKQVNP